MKPVKFSVKKTSNNHSYLKLDQKTVIAKIQGEVKKLKFKYADALIVLYSKESLNPLAVRKPDAYGRYQFTGLNANLKTFVVAFDSSHQFNAVIQDNVVPK
ncbi:MAG: hypothetical protein ACN6OV_00575 [Acinetobacter sp.]|uniref:hypothetical protein n=1 Tax=Acinetobacter sp. TaxID=472 RepID=UPI003D090126